MRFIFLLLVVMSGAHAHEKNLNTKADQFAKGVFKSQRHHPWPFSLLSIGHNMQSYQNYGGSPYWHDGLDIRSRELESIQAAAGGVVVNLENYVRGDALYWEVAILDDEGFVWKYHHVDRSSIPKEIEEAYKAKTRIKSGTFIGKVVRWPVTTYGEIYHHLHLLIVGKDGKYINPFLMMEPLPDNQSPRITKIGLAKNHRPIEGREVSGPHALYLEASDLTLHNRFILPPHKISYQLDNGPEMTVWEFTHLPSGTNDTDYINDFYMTGTCGNYNCRKFYFNLNFSLANPRGTFKLTPGMHEVDVIVEDVVGNKTMKNFLWKVL